MFQIFLLFRSLIGGAQLGGCVWYAVFQVTSQIIKNIYFENKM
jgi:hypothetical protein